jgi:PTH1 family peptidyl-tRNA hydrolase
MKTQLIAGLGNPGEKYQKTRHNIGFILLDLLAEEMNANFEFNSNFNAEIAEFKSGPEKIILCKPFTFMNNSGQAVAKIVNYYKIDLKDILIIQDEIDLPFGKIKFATNSSSAGHKGIQSIVDYLGTQEFQRLRFGINHETKPLPTEIFVLKNFSQEELQTIANFNPQTLLNNFEIRK